MLKIVSFISISLHHILACYWPYLINRRLLQNNQSSLSALSRHNNNQFQISDILINKITIIYENSMIGMMIGLSFFHLLPSSNDQIAQSLSLYHLENNNSSLKSFPFGNLTAVFTFVFVLVNSNYFYHANSKTKIPNVQNFRNRFQFQYQLLSNKKLKLRRRLAIQNFSTQVMISLPSILLTSSLCVSQNNLSLWFWCMIIILFQKQKLCQTFARSYFALNLPSNQVFKLILFHLLINWIYLISGFVIVELYSFMNGVLNGVSCGVLIYDVMIEKLAVNYQGKNGLGEKIMFLLLGVGLSALIIQS